MFTANPNRRSRRRLMAPVAVVLLACGLLVGTVGGAGAAPPPWAGPPFGGADPDPAIGVCCAWNADIADGITYSVAGAPSEDLEGAIEAGVEAWDTAIGGLTLTRDDASPEVTIQFKPSGGNVQGSARRSFDGAGFITSVAIKISAKSFGEANDLATIQQIVTHEFGHALGAGHANTGGFMMSPSLSSGSTVITACDVAAVAAAQHWYVVEGDTDPHSPHDSSVPC